MWECWNVQNRFIFGTPYRNLSMLGERAIDFVSSFHLAQLNETPPQPTKYPTTWSLPIVGYLKLNFDGCSLSNGFWGWGWGLSCITMKGTSSFQESSMVPSRLDLLLRKHDPPCMQFGVFMLLALVTLLSNGTVFNWLLLLSLVRSMMMLLVFLLRTSFLFLQVLILSDGLLLRDGAIG